MFNINFDNPAVLSELTHVRTIGFAPCPLGQFAFSVNLTFAANNIPLTKADLNAMMLTHRSRICIQNQ